MGDRLALPSTSHPAIVYVHVSQRDNDLTRPSGEPRPGDRALILKVSE